MLKCPESLIFNLRFLIKSGCYKTIQLFETKGIKIAIQRNNSLHFYLQNYIN